jgi:hypothetical protein
MQNINLRKIIRNNLAPILISFFCFALFFDGFKTYFHQDDFIQMFYSQNLKSVFDAFNIFKKAEFAFYRPIPTQLYFFITKSFFGWNPMGYHVVNFMIFVANIFLIYRFVKNLVGKKSAAFSALFFAVNTTHFAPLHAASYVHELCLVFFALLSCLFFSKYLKSQKLKNLGFSIIFFIFALMSKETAVVIPGLIAIEYLFFKKRANLSEFIKIISVFTFVLFFYLFCHSVFYGMPESSSYKLMIGKDSLKMYFWYLIWGLSAPNILIDFLEPGLKIRSVFFEITKINGQFFLIIFPVFLIILIIIFVILILIKRNSFKLIFYGFSWFVISLIPLVVFPLHKLAIEQALALVGLSTSIGYVLSQVPKKIAVLVTFLYILIAINSYSIAEKTHWILRSSYQAKSAVEKIRSLKIKDNQNQIVYFQNGKIAIPEYGSAKQIYLATGNGKLFPLMFGIPINNVFFEDVVSLPTNYNSQSLRIDSSKLLGY